MIMLYQLFIVYAVCLFQCSLFAADFELQALQNSLNELQKIVKPVVVPVGPISSKKVERLTEAQKNKIGKISGALYGSSTNNIAKELLNSMRIVDVVEVDNKSIAMRIYDYVMKNINLDEAIVTLLKGKIAIIYDNEWTIRDNPGDIQKLFIDNAIPYSGDDLEIVTNLGRSMAASGFYEILTELKRKLDFINQVINATEYINSRNYKDLCKGKQCENEEDLLNEINEIVAAKVRNRTSEPFDVNTRKALDTLDKAIKAKLRHIKFREKGFILPENMSEIQYEQPGSVYDKGTVIFYPSRLEDNSNATLLYSYGMERLYHYFRPNDVINEYTGSIEFTGSALEPASNGIARFLLSALNPKIREKELDEYFAIICAILFMSSDIWNKPIVLPVNDDMEKLLPEYSKKWDAFMKDFITKAKELGWKPS